MVPFKPKRENLHFHGDPPNNQDASEPYENYDVLNPRPTGRHIASDVPAYSARSHTVMSKSENMRFVWVPPGEQVRRVVAKKSLELKVAGDNSDAHTSANPTEESPVNREKAFTSKRGASSPLEREGKNLSRVLSSIKMIIG